MNEAEDILHKFNHISEQIRAARNGCETEDNYVFTFEDGSSLVYDEDVNEMKIEEEKHD